MNKENSDTYSVTCRCPRLLIFVLAAALVFGAVCVGGVCGAVWDGTAVNQVPDWYNSGVTDDDGKGKKYTIKTAKDLAGLAYMVNSGKDDFADDTIILEADIDLAGKQWTPIGCAYLSDVKPNQGQITLKSGSHKPFMGTFNGNGKSISNLYLKPGSGETAGLFGYVKGGTIKNLNIDGKFTVRVSGKDVTTSCYFSLGTKYTLTGSLVGLLQGGEVIDCSVLDYGVYIPDGNQANDRIFGGLIGAIFDADGDYLEMVDGMYPIGDYLKGDSSVVYVGSGYNKPWGLIVGFPVIGDFKEKPDLPSDSEEPEEPINPGNTVDDNTATYVINIYEMDTEGVYSLISSNVYVGMIGNEVTAHYTLSEGFSLDYSTEYYSVTKGTIIDNNDGKYLSLNVYLKRNPIFKITIPDSLVISNETYEGGMRVGVEIQLIPRGSLSIYIHSLNNFKLVEKKSPHVTLPYSLYIGNTLTNKLLQGDEIARYGKRSTLLSTSIVLVGEMTGTPKYSGTYEDTLTFTVEYSDTN